MQVPLKQLILDEIWTLNLYASPTRTMHNPFLFFLDVFRFIPTVLLTTENRNHLYITLAGRHTYLKWKTYSSDLCRRHSHNETNYFDLYYNKVKKEDALFNLLEEYSDVLPLAEYWGNIDAVVSITNKINTGKNALIKQTPNHKSATDKRIIENEIQRIIK